MKRIINRKLSKGFEGSFKFKGVEIKKDNWYFIDSTPNTLWLINFYAFNEIGKMIYHKGDAYTINTEGLIKDVFGTSCLDEYGVNYHPFGSLDNIESFRELSVTEIKKIQDDNPIYFLKI